MNIDCKLRGFFFFAFRTFDGEKFPIDGEHIEQKFEDDYATLKLIIHNATKDDAGKYGCTITNTLGSETCSARLTVTSKLQI